MSENESHLPTWVQDGDILLIQKPFKDETQEDYNTLQDINEMHINHTALVTDITSSHCISHSVTEGFNFPTCRNTKLWNGIYLVVRCSNNEIASNAVSICKKWCSGAELIDQETYLKRYDHHRWNDRRTRDLKTFKHAEKVATQCNIYAEPRATNDIREADKNPSIKSMTETSIVRAIKFSSRRNLTCRISKGFRCTL
ncbi:hypothetical protein C9374_004096 [Naegleria lovaniensis]|uniref:Uncharacterized protein n=1 Tax=Naegleria lovaniensis TaxID=51637 RepID=A0AA88GN51_NAELO|nr:uncharacterized protein C9374_004096 [Naegleria lovaniensis]KAG2383425.1 hypothetical protein C9374_004096 [Naegleria lovaniensis]